MRTTAAVLREMGIQGPYGETRPLTTTKLDLDDPGPGELLVKVRAAGLCHSDLSVIEGNRPRVMPMALGHEAAGEVVATGSTDSGFTPGDHVVLAFVPACGECRFCQQERPALCVAGAAANHSGTLLGGEIRMHDADGHAIHHHLGISAFADHIVVSERSAVRIADDLPFEIAALFGCAVMTGAGAVLNTGACALPARSIAVFGLGGVGLAALLAAASTSPEALIAVDPIADKRTLALDLGATHAVDPTAPDNLEQIRTATGDGDSWGSGVELALETVGSEKVLAQAWAATGRGGTTITAGLPRPEVTVEIPALSITAEERTLKGSYVGSCVPGRDIPRFIEMYREGRLPVDRLLSHRLTADQINEGFDRLARGEAVRQVVLFD